MKTILLISVIAIAGIASAQYQYVPPALDTPNVPIPTFEEPMTFQEYARENAPQPVPGYTPTFNEHNRPSASALTKCWAYTAACKSPFK